MKRTLEQNVMIQTDGIGAVKISLCVMLGALVCNSVADSTRGKTPESIILDAAFQHKSYKTVSFGRPQYFCLVTFSKMLAPFSLKV